MERKDRWFFYQIKLVGSRTTTINKNIFAGGR